MRQLEEQIRVLVDESMMRKRRRLDHPQPSASTAAINNTPAGASGQPKRPRKTPQSNAASVNRAKKAAKEAAPPLPTPPVAAPAPPIPVSALKIFHGFLILPNNFIF